MLQPYLVKYVESVDGENYRVRLINDIQYSANQAFEDGDYFSAHWFSEFWRSFFRSKLRSSGLQIKPGSLVLDCCSGQGYLGELIEREFGARVVCCDLSQPQLRKSLERFQALSSTGMAVCAADLLHMPYGSATFDLVVGNSFLHHIPDVPAALAELCRVVKPGGQLVLLHEPTITSAFWESFPLSLIKDTTIMEGGFTDLWMFAPEDMARLVRDAGFSRVHVLGLGILSTLFLNWYLLLAIKLNWRSRWYVYPAYCFRVWLNRLDMAFQSKSKTRLSPSLMVVAAR